MFIRTLFLLVCVSLGLSAAEPVQLDTNPALFAVLAAINAAGYDTGLNAADVSPVRLAVRERLQAQALPILPRLKAFYAEHKKKDATADLSQYLSFALSIQSAPDFAYRFKPQELPPDVAALSGFEELMQRFYQEGHLAELWQQVQPYYEGALSRYQGPVRQSVQEVNAYLRYTQSGFLGRRFVAYIDLMGVPNQVQSRSYGDDYLLVVTPPLEMLQKTPPAAAPNVEEVRHGYLHYLLDPLATKFSEKVEEKRGLSDYAQGAPTLDAAYKTDFLLLTTESLIKAVEGRLASPSKRPALMADALRQGFVLTPFFAEELPVYEKQQVAMRLFYPDMIAAIDLKKEARRLDNIEFVQTRPVRHAPTSVPAPPTGVQKTLADAEELYTAKALDQSKEMYLRALQQTENATLHAQAYYGLARIATRQKRPDDAVQLFERVLQSNPDIATKAWTHFYLGRLSDLSQEREQAVAHYKSVLALEGAPDTPRRLAQEGLQTPLTKP